jgi:hypothetical protein
VPPQRAVLQHGQPAALDVRDVGHAMRSLRHAVGAEHPRKSTGLRAAQCAREGATGSIIETVQGFVEQQHVGPHDQRPRQQHPAALAVRQLQKPSSRETEQTDVRKRAAYGTPLRSGRQLKQQVVAGESRRDDLRDAQVELATIIAILSLGSQVRDALAGGQRLLLPLAVDAIQPPLEPGGRRPEVATQQLEQHRLACAVRPDQQPALPGAQFERHVPQRPVASEAHARPFEPDRGQAGGRGFPQSPCQT